MKVIGRFYFRQTSSGNLLGEFSNNHTDCNITESANLKGEFKNVFIGDFKSTWYESIAHSLDLNIKYKEYTGDKLYTLVWKKGDIPKYYGEGFLVDNILIGDYRNFEVI